MYFVINPTPPANNDDGIRGVVVIIFRCHM